ncbi:methyltransferase domain-containing protein [Idiomarina sp. Sol25]|uniref:methyltransferase domain-containing protein n=1 Tax=Idiomarina sp. Sol25 TaxID=3064000 RepID=UPI00294AB653|nr:methyltransferase domain-containing protein [Idiomarina sp. Sol25]MDV6328079.1 methyltransferase domain-containing protein [Idiomarina sp. Sol25]
MSQSGKTNNDEFKLAIFYWLVEDWQGCKQELKRLTNSSTPHNESLAHILEGLIFLEKNNKIPQDLQGFCEQSFQEKAMLQKFLWANIEKSVLKAKHLLGDEVSDSRIRKLIKALTQTTPTPKSTELVKRTIINQENLENQRSIGNSVDTWITALQKKAISLGSDKLLQAEATLNSLNRGEKDTLKHKRVLADQLMSQNKFQNASRLYNNIISTSGATESLSVKLSRAQRNLGNTAEAIKTLESGIKYVGRQAILLHMLALYNRDQQEFKVAVQLVKEIINEHYEYSQKIGFATFAADMLRKNAEYIAAYEHLKKAALLHLQQGKEEPLAVKAILEELSSNVASGKEAFFEVSSKFYDFIYLESSKYASESEGSVYVPVWKKVCEIINQSNLKKVIDIGCGPGQFAEYFVNHCPHVKYLGLDFSEVAVDLAKERCPNMKFSCENVNEYTDILDSKDVAYVLLEVLEHIELDLELINQLSTGSLVIFSVPNFDSFGHVRFFLNKTQIMERFAPYFSNFEVVTISLSRTSKIYIGKGYRSS